MSTRNPPADASSGAPHSRKRCAQCRKLFVRKTKWQRFCCSKCKDDYHNLGPAFGALKARGLGRLIEQAAAELNKSERSTLHKRIAQLEARVTALEHKS